MQTRVLHERAHKIPTHTKNRKRATHKKIIQIASEQQSLPSRYIPCSSQCPNAPPARITHILRSATISKQTRSIMMLLSPAMCLYLFCGLLPNDCVAVAPQHVRATVSLASTLSIHTRCPLHFLWGYRSYQTRHIQEIHGAHCGERAACMEFGLPAASPSGVMSDGPLEVCRATFASDWRATVQQLAKYVKRNHVPSVVLGEDTQRSLVHALMQRCFSASMQASLDPPSAAAGNNNTTTDVPLPSVFLKNCDCSTLPAKPLPRYQGHLNCPSGGPPVPLSDGLHPGSTTEKREDTIDSDRCSFVVSGDTPNIHWVHQGEYGFVATDASPSTVTVHQEGDVPSALWRGATIASTDATSCVVVAVRAVWLGPTLPVAQNKIVVAMAHLDAAGNDVPRVLDDMVNKMVVPAMVLMRHPTARDDVGRDTGYALQLQWYVVGGMHDDKYALPLLADLSMALALRLPASTTIAIPAAAPAPPCSTAVGGANATPVSSVRTVHVALAHVLRLDGVCFWDMNTRLVGNEGSAGVNQAGGGPVGERTCCVWGLRIDAASGSCCPCYVRPGTRRYPAGLLRDMGVGKYRSTAVLYTPPTRQGAWPTAAYRCGPADGTAKTRLILNMPTTSAPNRTVSLGFLDYVQLSLDASRRWSSTASRQNDAGSDMHAEKERRQYAPVIVQPCQWAQGRQCGGMTDQQLLQWSTTPRCEPPDFVACIRRKLVFEAVVSPEDVFGSLGGKDVLPIIIYGE